MFPQWTEEGSVATCQHEEVLEEVRNALEEVLGAQKEVEENAGMILNAGSLEEAKQLYLIYQVSAESEERERRVQSRDGTCGSKKILESLITLNIIAGYHHVYLLFWSSRSHFVSVSSTIAKHLTHNVVD